MKTKEILKGEVNMLINRDEKKDVSTVRITPPDNRKEIYSIWSEPKNSWWDRGSKKKSKQL